AHPEAFLLDGHQLVRGSLLEADADDARHLRHVPRGADSDGLRRQYDLERPDLLLQRLDVLLLASRQLPLGLERGLGDASARAQDAGSADLADAVEPALAGGDL